MVGLTRWSEARTEIVRFTYDYVVQDGKNDNIDAGAKEGRCDDGHNPMH
jgi:hypothetical protein